MVSYKSSAVKNISFIYTKIFTFQITQWKFVKESIGQTHWLDNVCIDLIRDTISYYVIHFRMARADECPLAAVCTTVSRETSRFSETPNLMRL